LPLLVGIFVTAIYTVGLLIKKKPRLLGIGLDSFLVLMVYLVSPSAFYMAR
jgi:cation:H+ antiporter